MRDVDGKPRYDEVRDFLSSRKILIPMGDPGDSPDEYHEKYPDREEPGIDNNAYTNVLTAWLLCRTIDAVHLLPRERRRDLMESLSISEEEMDHWEDISLRMFVPFHGDGIISQFEGYDQLEELDWDRYRKSTTISTASIAY